MIFENTYYIAMAVTCLGAAVGFGAYGRTDIIAWNVLTAIMCLVYLGIISAPKKNYQDFAVTQVRSASKLGWINKFTVGEIMFQTHLEN